jgi:NitT/TauT family transport system permease protein
MGSVFERIVSLVWKRRPAVPTAGGEGPGASAPEPGEAQFADSGEPEPHAPTSTRVTPHGGHGYADGPIELPRARPGLLRIRESVRPTTRLVLSLLPFMIAAAWWVWVTSGGEPEFRHLAPTILPSPQEVAGQAHTLLTDGHLVENILVSLTRVLAGFAIAAVLAVPLGIMMGASGRINATFSLMMTILSYLPVPAIVPLTLAWWGSGEQQKIGFLALVTFAGLLPQIVRAVAAVDHKYVLSAYSQGATAQQVIARVLVPIAMPDLVNALRMCLGIGWTYILLVEVIRAGEGLGGVGNLIMVYHRLGHMPEVYLTVAAIIAVGAAMDRTCQALQRSSFPWSQQGGRADA